MGKKRKSQKFKQQQEDQSSLQQKEDEEEELLIEKEEIQDQVTQRTHAKKTEEKEQSKTEQNQQKSDLIEKNPQNHQQQQTKQIYTPQEIQASQDTQIIPQQSEKQDNSIENKSESEQQQEEEDEKCTVFQAQINLFKGLVGLGILALPIGFSQVGWVLGITLIPIVGYVMYYCATLMLDLADNNNLNPVNIAEFCYIMFKEPGVKGSGKGARFWVTVFLFCLQLGMCIGYTIFFINYFQASFCHYGWGHGCEDRVYAVLFALGIVIPLGLIRNIKHLKGPSNIANLILIFSLLVMLYDCYSVIAKRGPRLEKSVDFWGLANYIGIVVFTLEGVGLFFDIRHSMKEPQKFKPALLNVVHVAVLMYVVMGFMGYMAFGNKVADLLLFNLPMNNDFYFSIQIAYSMVLCLTFPLQLFPVANCLELEIKNSLFRKPKLPQITQQQQQQSNNNNIQTPTPIPEESIQQEQDINQEEEDDDEDDKKVELQLNEEEEKTLKKYSYGMRIILTLGIFCIAMTLKKVSVFLNLAGCIGGIALLYIIPVIIFNLNAQNVTQKTLIINWVISGVGIFAGLCGVYVSVMEIKADMQNGLDLFFF